MLITLADLKEALGIPTGDTSNDAQLNSAIMQANALIKSYIGFDISDFETERPFTTVLESPVQSVLLPAWPVMEVVSLSFDGEAQTVDNWVLNPNNGIIYMQNHLIGGGAWHGYPGNRGLPSVRVSVVFRAGIDPVPDDLQMVCVNLASMIYANGGSFAGAMNGGKGDLKSMTIFDGMSMSFETNVGASADAAGTPQGALSAWAFVLDQYRTRLPGMA